jgi:Fe-S-cluster containining protein
MIEFCWYILKPAATARVVIALEAVVEVVRMADYIRMKDGTEYSLGENLSAIDCFRCGVCCVRYRPPVTCQEIENIARSLDISQEEFTLKYLCQVLGTGLQLIQNSEDKCPFLAWEETGERAHCTIYDVRPAVCRDWEAKLSKSECREGLARLKESGTLLPADEIYQSDPELKKLCSILFADNH